MKTIDREFFGVRDVADSPEYLLAGRTAGISIFHLVKKTCAFNCRRIALPYLFVWRASSSNLACTSRRWASVRLGSALMISAVRMR